MMFGSLQHLELHKNSCIEHCRQYTVIAYDCMCLKKIKTTALFEVQMEKQLKFGFGLMEY